MNIELNINKKMFTPKLFPYLLDYSHRFEGFVGSAGSSKSYFITQKLIIRACNEANIRILVTRRYGTTIRNSCFNLFKEILNKWKLIENNIAKVNEGDMRIRFINGSEIIFLGLDDEQKLLSINNISAIFIEEATELDRDTVEQLNIRLRGHANNLQIIMAWNPISSTHWLYDYWEVNPPENSLYVHTTYKDNPFLPEAYVKALEELETRNPKKWKVFGLGLWGANTDGLVFSNWEEQDFDIYEIARTYPHRVGCDTGYMDPTAIVESFYDEANHIIYVSNEFYRSGQTLDNIYDAIVRMRLSKCKIQFDSAEPRTIDFFRRKNINAVPCIKGANSVSARIAFLQNNKIIVHPNCKSLINELSNFSYIKDRKTDKYQDDKTTHEFSHAIDALSYAYSDLYTTGRLRTLDKSVLGL